MYNLNTLLTVFEDVDTTLLSNYKNIEGAKKITIAWTKTTTASSSLYSLVRIAGNDKVIFFPLNVANDNTEFITRTGNYIAGYASTHIGTKILSFNPQFFVEEIQMLVTSNSSGTNTVKILVEY